MNPFELPKDAVIRFLDPEPVFLTKEEVGRRRSHTPECTCKLPENTQVNVLLINPETGIPTGQYAYLPRSLFDKIQALIEKNNDNKLM